MTNDAEVSHEAVPSVGGGEDGIAIRATGWKIWGSIPGKVNTFISCPKCPDSCG